MRNRGCTWLPTSSAAFGFLLHGLTIAALQWSFMVCAQGRDQSHGLAAMVLKHAIRRDTCRVLNAAGCISPRKHFAADDR